MMNNGTALVIKNRNIAAILAALSLFLSFIEYMIPKPIPFLKIGLANLPLLIGLPLLSTSWFLLLSLTKIIAQAIVSGSLISYVILFSFFGSMASSIVMLFLHRVLKDKISLTGISIMGALASNVVQLVLARFLIFGTAAWLIAPPFLLMGIVTSFLLGCLADRFSVKSIWIKKIREERE